MFVALLTLSMAATPQAAQAEGFAARGEWEELYLAFAAAQPKAFKGKDGQRIARALQKGCDALLATDAVMAFSLGEKSVAFSSAPEAVVCTARAAIKTDQRTAADDALRAGLKHHPKDGAISLELAKLRLEEKDGRGAVEVLRAIPKSSKAFDEAQTLLVTAESLAREASSARAELVRREKPRAAVEAVEPPSSTGGVDEVEEDDEGLRGPGRRTPPKLGESRTYESSVDEEGRRIRQNAYFRFRYFNAQRDFGQRADYEGRVQGALEEARVAARNVMGVARESALDVILYSKSEFTLHHGPWAAAAIAGFYSQSAIRMNDSAEINPRNQATLVHEYVHAVVDELCQFDTRGLPKWVNEGLAEFVEWEYTGRSRPEGRYDAYIRQLASQKRLPSLATMRDDPLIASSDPGLLYSYAALAMRSYVQRYGMADLVGLLRDVGRGKPFDQAFAQHTSSDLVRFEESVRDEILSR
ncbi:MAG: hypothetical protein JNJ54_03375 [Myxococcaceae bacterium]|nr:hypothetical protein [Myxococcaceae bacterium]